MSNTTTRTIYFATDLSRETADTLNLESGRIYSQGLVEHYRIYRHTGHWLSSHGAMRLNDFYNQKRQSLLHAHSIDAAQEGFYKACKTAKQARKAGLEVKYPHKFKRYRTTIWKNTGIRVTDGCLMLALGRGNEPIKVKLPEPLKQLSPKSFVEMRLVYNKSSRHYEWHLVVKDGVQSEPVQNGHIAAGDLGEIHPITLTDGVDACVVSCRELRSVSQHTNKHVSNIQRAQSNHKRGSRRWKRLQRKKNRFLAKQEKRRRDLEHKISRAAVDWCGEHQISTLALGDVRDISDGKRLNAKSQQKISNWSHGKMRRFITYKAEAVGIAVIDTVDEAYTSQTCAGCGNRYKPKGRVYTCPTCGSIVHRDVQGAANILSRFLYRELAKVPIPEKTTYRHPILRGKRSSPGHGASCSKITR